MYLKSSWFRNFIFFIHYHVFKHLILQPQDIMVIMHHNPNFTLKFLILVIDLQLMQHLTIKVEVFIFKSYGILLILQSYIGTWNSTIVLMPK